MIGNIKITGITADFYLIGLLKILPCSIIVRNLCRERIKGKFFQIIPSNSMDLLLACDKEGSLRLLPKDKAGDQRETFFRILGWNILWAFLSTFVNYFLGLGLALLLSKKCVKGKAFWRAFPILAYAIPGFITLIAFKFMFSVSGPLNYYITSGHLYDDRTIDFLGMDSTWSARIIGLAVNAWLTVPTTMLLATGILSNVQSDLYEAADIDGASKTRQFFDITLPYVIFATTPTLISQFIGNFNNFGTFYFLRGSIISEGYFQASDTDLLINWLYRLSLDGNNNYYSIAAAVSLLIFIITSAISLLVYVRSGSYKKEDTYR